MNPENDRNFSINVEFYTLLKEYLRTGKISQYVAVKRKNFIMEEAENYKLDNQGEVLFCDKIVIIDAVDRVRILGTVHVNPKTGVHAEADAMLRSLKDHFHWQSMHEDIDKYVKNCSQCTPSLVKKEDAASAADDSSTSLEKSLTQWLEGCSNNSTNLETTKVLTHTQKVGTPTQLASPPIQTLILNFGVWDLVELKILRLHGASPKYWVALSDPISKWMDVASLSVSHEDLASNCADFLYKHMTILGFTQFHLVGFSVAEQQQFLEIFSKKYRNLTDQEWPHKNAVTFELCPWVQQKLNNFDVNRLETEVFMYRNKPLPELNGLSPSEKILLHPRKILGQNCKLPDVQAESYLALEQTLDDQLEFNDDLDKDAVEAIKLYSLNCKTTKSKKAPKFSMGIKRAITMYASKHGNADTAQFISKKIGRPLTTNRVRIICQKYIELCSTYSTQPPNEKV